MGRMITISFLSGLYEIYNYTLWAKKKNHLVNLVTALFKTYTLE
jgi:hypothetical protein